MSINSSKTRVGNITSSGIADILALAKNGKDMGDAALSYIAACNMERRFDLPIGNGGGGTETEWGTAIEPFVHDILPLTYEYSSQITATHPDIDWWCGSADGFNHTDGIKAVFDIKAPFTRASFYGLVMPLMCDKTGIDAMYAIRDGFTHDGVEYPKHKQGKKYYWQLVSNACINGTDWAELIVYMPYQSELVAISQVLQEHPRLKWLGDTAPYINDGGFFKNLNIIRFEVPQSDKDLLTAKVRQIGKHLIKRQEPSVIIASPTDIEGVVIIEKV